MFHILITDDISPAGLALLKSAPDVRLEVVTRPGSAQLLDLIRHCDAVITELAQIRSIIVRPSSVIAKYQGKEIDPRETGRELRVHAVLSAGFLRATLSGKPTSASRERTISRILSFL